jgi:hypothetical protein
MTFLYDSENGSICHAILSSGSTTLVIHPWFDWLLFQQNKIHKVAHILAYLPYFDTVMRTNGKCGHVSRNRMEYPPKET